MNHLHSITRSHDQRGMALVMALVFLVLLTLLGITAMSTSSLEEKMAGNSKDRGLAFQAAESALLHGENWIANQVNLPIFDPSDLTDGLHLPSTTATPVWTDAGGTNVWAGNDIMTFSGLTKVWAQPKVIVENLGPLRDPNESLGMPGAGSPTSHGATNAFRVTARGVGGTAFASVMVQSVYAKRY
jgi:type IV pilus assembly protein PilX